MSKQSKYATVINSPPLVSIKTSQTFPFEGRGETVQQTQADCGVQAVGKHLIVDFWDAQFLQDIDLIETALKDAARDAGATLLHIHLHQFSSEGGITGVALLAESHISIHTWPELDFAAFDVFMCGNAEPQKAVDYLISIFKPGKVKIKEILRG